MLDSTNENELITSSDGKVRYYTQLYVFNFEANYSVLSQICLYLLVRRNLLPEENSKLWLFSN